MWKSIVAATLFVGVFGSANAQSGIEVVARCGPLDGFAYFFPTPNMAANETGWQRDRISNGSFMLVRDRAGQFDIIFTDATRRTLSATSDGARVIALREGPETYIVLSVYAGLVEVYMFKLDPRGGGSMTLSQTRHAAPVPVIKAGVMVAPCDG
jgi:hypothetical protein